MRPILLVAGAAAVLITIAGCSKEQADSAIDTTAEAAKELRDSGAGILETGKQHMEDATAASAQSMRDGAQATERALERAGEQAEQVADDVAQAARNARRTAEKNARDQLQRLQDRQQNADESRAGSEREARESPDE